MAKTSRSMRKLLPSSGYGERGAPKPAPTKPAANAKARATQAVKAGRMSASTAKKIDAKANRKLDRS